MQVAVGVPVTTGTTEEGIETLRARGFPPGLVSSVQKSVDAFPCRFWIIDNSGSMNHSDGKRLIQSGTKLVSIGSTRWAEIGDTVMMSAEIATALSARTDYLLLNARPEGQHFTVADPGDSALQRGQPADLATMRNVMQNGSPSGGTPLTEAVLKLHSIIAAAADKLTAHGQQACVVLATDGLPNDPTSFLVALRNLQTLPVWVVVRLCTNQDDVVEYWNDLDAKLESPLEVLDDVEGEAAEVHSHNPWLAYGPPLHAAREFGLQAKLFDLLDEKPLIPSQIKQFAELLLGCSNLPEPEVDRKGFAEAVKNALAEVPLTYDPRTKSMKPWINVKHIFGGSGGCVVC
mmetsp:Transcript_24810/g.56549  ORF Transcript_24810/g.56549 Transcript_24810/m.56549 type:complete len:346 (-) Transcript_24810:238-1275(-)|eukprot:CAMPEP_0181201618 /NCGR_PEP_ID=MMETSP1096-20121128/18403_1 /TAXON_ID=156174 ORGANISM="Chrysochromulina ericina, Strain CCMP281" /NCGR_SAMPLE_ID=MMETSP1096 /ASSEMBLY_ACC=CAM_ASM_000453 /LENGTH=345 /DNA_ID=CAMNT_0023292073 /DNA_START=45 /DNA_END=1082 /DNA_ORIENTATION=-